jgi:hypothetical protein
MFFSEINQEKHGGSLYQSVVYQPVKNNGMDALCTTMTDTCGAVTMRAVNRNIVC